GGPFVTLHHSGTPGSEEGRAVQFFDILGGADSTLNQQRIGDELANHRFATGSVPLDARPIALAITKQCITRDAGANNVTPTLTGGIGFFTDRNGFSINDLFNNTSDRARTMPRRKADIEKFNLFRTNDPYLDLSIGGDSGLIQQYGAATSQGPSPTLER